MQAEFLRTVLRRLRGLGYRQFRTIAGSNPAALAILTYEQSLRNRNFNSGGRVSKEFTSAWLNQRNARSLDIQTKSDGVGLESELHKAIEAELKRRRWYYVHSRMDKRTTTQLGVTDFIVAIPAPAGTKPKTLWCEAKRKGGKLTKEQNITRHILLAAGHWHETVYSFEEFLSLLNL